MARDETCGAMCRLERRLGLQEEINRNFIPQTDFRARCVFCGNEPPVAGQRRPAGHLLGFARNRHFAIGVAIGDVGDNRLRRNPFRGCKTAALCRIFVISYNRTQSKYFRGVHGPFSISSPVPRSRRCRWSVAGRSEAIFREIVISHIQCGRRHAVDQSYAVVGITLFGGEDVCRAKAATPCDLYKRSGHSSASF